MKIFTLTWTNNEHFKITKNTFVWYKIYQTSHVITILDCNVIKDDYTHIAVHKLDRNNVEQFKFDQNCQIHLLLPT